MLYLVSDVTHPVEYLSSGNLVSFNFVHPDRLLDSHVLIVVRKGTLYINQSGVNYDIGPNEFIVLFAGQHHFGYKPSDGPISYYWTHFLITDPEYKYYSPSSFKRNIEVWNATPTQTYFTMTNFIIPEYGTLSNGNRTSLLFVQLLDTAKRDNYAATYRCHYILSFMMLEIGTEVLSSSAMTKQEIPTTIFNIIEWIRVNYDKNLTVQELASNYGYNPTYLSVLFKKYTGYPLISYINRTRIAISKNLLTGDCTLHVGTIGKMCGFQDEKLFMKVFKKIEGITPTQYRTAFCKKSINKK